MFEALGDRAKLYERRETDRTFMPLLPIYARLDGRGFSKFTKGMRRPYDPTMAECMLRTAEYLVRTTHARMAYTQSDEISLVFRQGEYVAEPFFKGKVQKLASVLAASATAAFIRELAAGEYADRLDMFPHFDCRVFQVPNEEEAANLFLWRELDATKNAITMAARAYYSHKQLHGKSGSAKQEMLHQKGVNFNDYPDSFKRGTYVRRVVEERRLTAEELEKIPEAHRPAPEHRVIRCSVQRLVTPPLPRVANRAQFILHNAVPVLREESPPGD